jgi:hypothetical protein
MQCLTDLIFLLVVVESVFNTQPPALRYRYFWQSLESGHPALYFLPAMSDSKSLNTSWPEVMIISTNALVFIRDVSDLILQIIFNACWASMNEGSKCPIAQNNSRHMQ